MKELVNCKECVYWLKKGDVRTKLSRDLMHDGHGICAKNAPSPSIVGTFDRFLTAKNVDIVPGKEPEEFYVSEPNFRAVNMFPTTSEEDGCFEGLR